MRIRKKNKKCLNNLLRDLHDFGHILVNAAFCMYAQAQI